jgi:hypothetical protein
MCKLRQPGRGKLWKIMNYEIFLLTPKMYKSRILLFLISRQQKKHLNIDNHLRTIEQSVFEVGGVI